MLKKKREQLDIRGLLQNKRLPIVTLDARWHTLFESGKPTRVAELEKNLNELMKQQGKTVTDVKELKIAKHKLLGGIVANMDTGDSHSGKLNSKKLDKSQKLIRDINSKLDEADNNLSEIPYKIKSANEELVVESMNDCYQRMHLNSEKIEDYEKQIEIMKQKLEEMGNTKKFLEQQNDNIYAYMHGILGHEVMEAMDQFYSKKK